MSIYRRKGSPNYIYDFQYKGNRFCRSCRTHSKKEAERVKRKVRDWLEAHDASGEILTLDAAFGKWWEEHGQHLKSRAVKTHVKALINGLGGDVPLGSLVNANIAAYVANRRLQVSNDTVNQDLKYLRTIFYRANEIWGHPVNSISWRRHRLKPGQLRIRWIPRDRADDLIAALDEKFRDMLALLFLTGCRKGELFGLTWACVDLQQRVIRILGKGNKWRNVYLSDDAFLLIANRPVEREGRVFPKRGFDYRFAQACAAIGLEDFTPHDARHSFATWTRQAGVSLEVLQRILGHSSIVQTTRYAHVADHEMRAAMSKIPSKSPITKSQAIDNIG